MSVIVIDVGCAKYGGDESIPHLINEFSPDLIIGLDPSLTLNDEPAVEWLNIGVPYDGAPICTVVRLRLAAWTRGGQIGFQGENLGGHVVEIDTENLVGCVDLASLVLAVPRNAEVVLKLDCEGAEYDLVPHLRERDADLRLRTALIEFHCADCGIGGNGRHRESCDGDHEAWDARRRETEDLLRCEVGEWNH